MRPPFEGGGGPRCAMPTRTPHPLNDLGGVDGTAKVVAPSSERRGLTRKR